MNIVKETNTNIMFCDKCKLHYFPNMDGTPIVICSICNSTLIDTEISYVKYKELPKVKRCTKCKSNYPKIFIKCPRCHSQLTNNSTVDKRRNQQYQEIVEKNTKPANVPICPYCNSTNVSKIGVLNRTASVAMLGLASSKIGKQWHCNNCKSDF